VVAEELVKLQKAWRGDARAILEEIAQRIDRAFRQFEESHFPAPPLTQPQPQLEKLRAEAFSSAKPRRVPAVPDWAARLLMAWRAAFGSDKKRAGEIASLNNGALVASDTPRGRAMKVANWAARVENQTLCLSDGQRVQLLSEPDSHNSAVKVYWLAVAPQSQ
jgi:hypothetical protein